MKKLFYIVSIITLPLHLNAVQTYQKFQMPLLQKQKIISNETINEFEKARFQKEFTNVIKAFNHFKAVLENFKNRVITYSQQPLSYQKNYDNFEQLFISFDHIKQKPLTIGITKLLQYKSAASPEMLEKANRFIDDLKKIVVDVGTTLKTIGDKTEWENAQFDNSQKISSDDSIAEAFKDSLITKFPFKIKKIRRSITNWQKS
jgi:hypothetical protein